MVNAILKSIVNTLCRIDSSDFFEILSKSKPMLIAVNHINFLEVPILVAQSYPLYVTGMAKTETWKNPFFAFLFNTYQAIPIDRNKAFRGAFNQVRKAVDDGFFVAVFPEGTRSINGVLGQGKAGIIHLAFHADVPVLPVVHYGGENIWKNIRQLRRTPFYFKAGRPFKIKFQGMPQKEAREEMLGEVMGQMARLLPVEMRGPYAGRAEQECKYLEFLE